MVVCACCSYCFICNVSTKSACIIRYNVWESYFINMWDPSDQVAFMLFVPEIVTTRAFILIELYLWFPSLYLPTSIDTLHRTLVSPSGLIIMSFRIFVKIFFIKLFKKHLNVAATAFCQF